MGKVKPWALCAAVFWFVLLIAGLATVLPAVFAVFGIMLGLCLAMGATILAGRVIKIWFCAWIDKKLGD